MTTATAANSAETVATVSLPERPYRMSYEVYERIGKLGMIRPEEHVVLLDGILVQTMNKGPDHYTATYEANLTLVRSVPAGWYVRQEAPIVLRGGPRGESAPEPDVAVVVGRNANYIQRHPEAHEVAIVVEIATSAAAFAADRAGLYRYAHAGIATALIVGLHDRSIHIFTEPTGPEADPSYRQVLVKRSGEFIELCLKPATADSPAVMVGPLAVGSFFPPTL